MEASTVIPSVFESEGEVTELPSGLFGEPAAVEVETELVDGLEEMGIEVGLTEDEGRRPSGVEDDDGRDTDNGCEGDRGREADRWWEIDTGWDAEV